MVARVCVINASSFGHLVFLKVVSYVLIAIKSMISTIAIHKSMSVSYAVGVRRANILVGKVWVLTIYIRNISGFKILDLRNRVL